MKVLIVHHQMKLYGGAELVVVHLARYLMKQGHTVRILAASSEPHIEYDGLDIITPKQEVQWHLWDGTISSLREIYGVYSRLKSLCVVHAKDFDVINPHNFPAIWAIPNNKPTVWMCNEVPDLWHRQKLAYMTNKLLDVGRLTDRIVARSKKPKAVVADENVANLFHHRYGLEPNIINYGIEGEFFAQPPKPRPMFSPYFRVLHPAIVSPSKNQAAILEAVRGLRHDIPSIEVVFSGYREPNSQYARYLDAYIAAHELDKYVTYIGPTSRESLRALYHTCHVAVFPGKGQGSWLGPFEQLAVGNPIIVSPSLSCSGIIQSHNFGIVTDDFLGAILKVYSDYTRYKHRAYRGQQFVLNELTWDNFGARMEEVMCDAT